MTLLPGPHERIRIRREPDLDDPERLSQILARRSGLTEADLKRIGAVQGQLGLGFIEAAMRLGLVTQTDVDAVLAGHHAEEEVHNAIARPASSLTSAHDPFDPHSENIRALRTELLIRAPAEKSNVLAVTSAGRGEGRSRLAAELAITFAQLGQATLLVDCDLRRSAQHDLFGADNSQGLAQALVEGRAPKVQPVVGLHSLSLLTAGPRVATPLEILSDPMFGEMLSGWKRRYRHIILDTPAVSEFSDGLAVATHAGRVLFVARAHSSSLSDARDAVRRMQSTHATVVGAVLNNF